MKKYIILGLLTLSLNLIATDVNSIENKNTSTKQSEKLFFNLDEEAKKERAKIDENRGEVLDTLRGIIKISSGNNDEVTFFGKELFKNKPIIVIVRDELDNIKDTIKNIMSDTISIKASKLDDEDSIIIKDNSGKVLVEKRVSK